MPPTKGNLAAITAILSLFLDGPETQGSIRSRLSREYADAHWSRSIVDAAIPSLLAQGLIVLIASGEKPRDNVYEVTPNGIEEFRRWMRESPRAPMPMREPLQLWIEHSTPEELPTLLAVIKETELAALREVRAAQERVNSDRTTGRLGPADGSEWNGRLRYAILSDKVLYWQGRVVRCKSFRMILRGGHNMHMRRPADGRGDDYG